METTIDNEHKKTADVEVSEYVDNVEAAGTSTTSTHSSRHPKGDHINEMKTKNYRPNTIEQKKKMRNERKKRRKAEKRKAMAESSTSAATSIEQDLHHEKEQSKRFKSEASLYKNMARTYWDRWQWDLQKRKEAMAEHMQSRLCKKSQPQVIPCVHEIDPNDLKDPIVDGVPKEVYIGRGSFSVVRLQQYRGIRVAVKEFLSRTLTEDIEGEATFLAKLCHPFLPHLFGISLFSSPMKLVCQFHGISDETVTLAKQLIHQPLEILEGHEWLILTTQLFDAVNYLHDNARILHNDIKLDNVLIAEDVNGDLIGFHIVLIDFGKACSLQAGRLYSLCEDEKKEYLKKYPHVAPEVVHREHKQSIHSDIYSVGKVLTKILDCNQFSTLPSSTISQLSNLFERCLLVDYQSRPSADRCLDVMNRLIDEN